MGIWYATREQVARSLEIAHTTRAGTLIDGMLDSSSRSIEGFLHRRFYPERRTVRRDWPSAMDGSTWQIELGDQEMISVESVVSGGTTITSGIYLSRGDNLSEPPYSLLSVDLSSSYAFAAGDTFQRSLSIVGLYGQNDTATSTPGGTLSGGINDSVTTLTIIPASGISEAEIGSLLLMGTERMVVINRRMASTGNTTTSALVAQQSSNTFTCADASEFAAGETILIDGERMRIDDISGTLITVTRAFDGSALTAHSSGSTIYALWEYLVQRGALGSTAAAHSNGAAIYVHKYPGLINQLCIAETVVGIEQNSSAYARTIGSGTREMETVGKGLEDLRQRAWNAYGRKMRSAAI